MRLIVNMPDGITHAERGQLLSLALSSVAWLEDREKSGETWSQGSICTRELSNATAVTSTNKTKTGWSVTAYFERRAIA